MVLPNSFVLAEDAKSRQSLLLREAEIRRLHRAAFCALRRDRFGSDVKSETC